MKCRICKKKAEFLIMDISEETYELTGTNFGSFFCSDCLIKKSKEELFKVSDVTKKLK